MGNYAKAEADLAAQKLKDPFANKEEIDAMRKKTKRRIQQKKEVPYGRGSSSVTVRFLTLGLTKGDGEHRCANVRDIRAPEHIRGTTYPVSNEDTLTWPHG